MSDELKNTSNWVGKGLSAECVREIRAKRTAGISLKVLAAEYGCSIPLISKIARRVIYKEIK